MRYEAPKPQTRESLQKAIEAGDINLICEVLVGLTFFESDWQWMQQQCLTLLKHDSPQVRGVAAICLGHVARIHGHIDLDSVIPALEAMQNDPSVAGRAADALDDINVFVTKQSQRGGFHD